MSLYVQFLGAIGSVTGSCTWLYHEPTKTQFLVDCGMYQGEANARHLNSKPFPFKPSEIAFVLLTHAHTDHCGLIPRLYKEGFTGEIWCNQPTADLAEIALDDATNLCDGLYSEFDRKKVRFRRLEDTRKPIRLAESLSVVLTRTSHLLGSASFEISWWKGEHMSKGQTICFSGDIGNNRKTNPFQSLLKGRQHPSPYCDYIVCESTYGGRERDANFESFERRINALADIFEEAYASEGTPILIFPAFAMQRTQEIIVDLYYLLNIYIHSNSKKFIRSSDSFDVLNSVGIGEERIRWQLKMHALKAAEVDHLMNSLISISDGKVTISPDTDDTSIERLRQLLSKDVLLPRLFCNSPLAKKYGEVFAKYLSQPKGANKENDFQHLNDFFLKRYHLEPSEVPDLFNWLFAGQKKSKPLPILTVKYIEANREIAPKGRVPNVLVSSSGMCEFGPIRPVIEAHAKNPNAMIILSGYQGVGTLGESLRRVMQLQMGEAEKDFQIEVGGKFIAASEVKAKIRDLSAFYSGHADSKGLLEFILSDDLKKQMRPSKLFLNHGDQKSREDLKKAIESAIPGSQRLITEIILPEANTGWFDLSSGSKCNPPIETHEPASSDAILARLDIIIDLLRKQTDLHEQTVEALNSSK